MPTKRKKNSRDLAARGFCPSCSKFTTQGPHLNGIGFPYLCRRGPDTRLLERVEFAKASGEIVSHEFIELTAEQWQAVCDWHESRMGEIWEFERKTMQSIAKEFPALLVSVLTPVGALKGSA